MGLDSASMYSGKIAWIVPCSPPYTVARIMATSWSVEARRQVYRTSVWLSTCGAG